MFRNPRYVSDEAVSTEKQELVPAKKEGHTTNSTIKKMSFINTEDCTIEVNGIPIKLQAGQGFQIEYNDPDIESFVISEAGINFKFVAVV